jgi:hypothetical protein
MTKVTVDVKQGGGFKWLLFALLFAACAALYVLWDNYADLKGSIVKSTENALNEYKAYNDSLVLIGKTVDSLSVENSTLKLKNDRLLNKMAEQRIKDKKEIKKVENLQPSEQIGLFGRFTNCEVLQSEDIALVPIEGIRTANILMTKGYQTENKVSRLEQIIENQNVIIRNSQITDSLNVSQIGMLKKQRGDLIITVTNQDLTIDKQDLRLKSQTKIIKGAVITTAISLLVAIIK